jgi:Fe2+ or Zn2+ uptake regulation protein
MHTGFRDQLLTSFREQGVRCTAQRYAILDYLNRHPEHPTAEEIHKAINRTDPRASLATVYKALHAMAEAGLIRELRIGGNAARFEAATVPHHHFVCDRCGQMEDIEWFELPKLPKGVPSQRRVTGYEVVLHGMCPACA